MTRLFIRVGIVLFCSGFALAQSGGRTAEFTGGTSPQAVRAVLDRYCVTCHNEKLATAGLLLDKMDPAHVGPDAEAWEKVARKLRAGMMPPPGRPRPDATAYDALTVAIENELDREAAVRPKLGAPGVHRINRAQYANAIRDLFGLEIDPAVYLPADDSSYGFDNVASGLQISPALVEGYLAAASKLSRIALGHETAPARKIYYAREDYSQEDHVEGLPFGTRGGMRVQHYFPADGEYLISWAPVRNTVGTLYGGDSESERIELTLDGARLKLYEIGKDIPLTANVHADTNDVRVSVKAGMRAVGLAFIANTYIPQVFLNRSYRRSILDDNPIEGIMQSPQVSRIVIQGPFNGARAKDTPSRSAILLCAPDKADKTSELACARTILSTLARKAFRRPVAQADVAELLRFYQAGRDQGDFEDGVERALEFILAHPEFVFRAESVPAGVSPGVAFRVSDLELASRLSFFGVYPDFPP